MPATVGVGSEVSLEVHPPPVPPLEAGDHLSRPEFERRYNAMPDLKKAELIEGIVYMPSPVSLAHSRPHSAVITWLGTYAIGTPGVEAADNTTVRLDMSNEPQPDGCLYILPACGGRVSIDEDYVTGGPELVVEIAASTSSIDLHSKRVVYERNGVLEYIVLTTREPRIYWHAMHNGAYDLVEPGSDGLHRSDTFPGLALDGMALLRGDYARMIERLNDEIGSDDHQRFVKRLTDIQGKVGR
jgi:Uma2 family endonuclease